MSKAATQYARRLRVGPDGKALSSAERRVLELIAWYYNDDLQYAFRKMGELAAELTYSPTYCRRIIATLEQRGVLLREAAKDAKGWQTTNNYRIPALVVSKTPAEEIDAERKWLRSFRAPMKQQLELCNALLPAKTAVDKRHGCVGPGETLCVGPGETLCVGPYREGKESMKVPPLTQVPAAVESAKPSADEAVGVCLVKAKAEEATASATAKAKAERGESVSREHGAVAGTGVRSRAGRELDGEDAALDAEVTRVMFACDFTSGAVRVALLKAMQQHVVKAACTIAQAGILAEQRWSEFNDPAVLRAWYPDPKRFYRDGLWLRPQAWRFDPQWLQDVRGSGMARTGADWRN